MANKMGPKPSNGIHHSSYSCSDLRKHPTSPSTTDKASVVFDQSPGARAYSAETSRNGSPPLLEKYAQVEDDSFITRLRAAVAAFFGIEIHEKVPASLMQSPEEYVYNTVSEQKREFFVPVELFPAGVTRVMPYSLLLQFYQVKMCQKMVGGEGWEGVSLDPQYAGSVFYVHDMLKSLNLNLPEVVQSPPIADPNCPYCNQVADDGGDLTVDEAREKWMKQCFDAFEEHANSVLKTPHPKPQRKSLELLEPPISSPSTTGISICADCKEALELSAGIREVQSIDYEPKVFVEEEAVNCCAVTRLRDPKFEEYMQKIARRLMPVEGETRRMTRADLEELWIVPKAGYKASDFRWMGASHRAHFWVEADREAYLVTRLPGDIAVGVRKILDLFALLHVYGVRYVGPYQDSSTKMVGRSILPMYDDIKFVIEPLNRVVGYDQYSANVLRELFARDPALGPAPLMSDGSYPTGMCRIECLEGDWSI